MLPKARAMLAATACLFVATGVAACGDDEGSSDSSDDATALDLTISEDSKGTAQIDVPSDVTGGLVDLSVTNDGKASHLIQFVRYDEGHTADEVLESIGGNAPPPEWIYGEGGSNRLAPGDSATATLNLDEGQYVAVDIPDGEPKGPPGSAEFTVSGGTEGDLPSTDATITAASLEDETSEEAEEPETEGGPPEQEYKWETSGLAAGEQEVTFDSEGDGALHHVIAVPIIGDATLEEVQKEFQSEPQEPKTVDFEKSQETAVLDGGKSSVVNFNLDAGRYALLCFLSDKGEKTSHVEEGLFDEVEVPES